jgi:hypothetical protein
MINKLYTVIMDRVSAMFAGMAATRVQHEYVTVQIGMKADLLRQADQYELEGLTDLAEELRERASQIDLDNPGSHSTTLETEVLAEANGADTERLTTSPTALLTHQEPETEDSVPVTTAKKRVTKKKTAKKATKKSRRSRTSR